MNPDPHVIISAAVPNPNPYPILISGVAFNVIVVLVSAWRTRRHAERLHRETLAAQRDELETKARHDLAAERREAQRKAHEVFLRAVAALDAAAYGYAARPHNKPSQALPERLTLWEDTEHFQLRHFRVMPWFSLEPWKLLGWAHGARWVVCEKSRAVTLLRDSP
ncbi:hypothetical protein [Streptomyces filamentosus]|uniref:hypothetical protein n=1 Tax=Streptomyces filamentosus TaxID=67294 RepID=UPI0033C850F9